MAGSYSYAPRRMGKNRLLAESIAHAKDQGLSVRVVSKQDRPKVLTGVPQQWASDYAALLFKEYENGTIT